MAYSLNETIRKERMKKIMDAITKTHNEKEKIIKEQFGGDKIAYAKANFSFKDITLEWGLSFDEIRKILYAHLPENSDRRKILINNENSSDLKTRIAYPGGFDTFVKDVNNGWYGNDKSIDEELL